MSKKKGILYCVGTGPGDPELITVKAIRIMKECGAVAFAVDAKGERLAYSIAQNAFPGLKEKQQIPVYTPMVMDKKTLQESHKTAAESLKAVLDTGVSVAYLTLGDPSVYASCMYPAKLVAEGGYAVEMVPGVPSFCAVAARLGEPLVLGSEELHIVPAWRQVESALDYPGTKVLMKAGSHMGTLKKMLSKVSGAVRAVECCGMQGEEIYRCTEELSENSSYYTVVVVRGDEH